MKTKPPAEIMDPDPGRISQAIDNLIKKAPQQIPEEQLKTLFGLIDLTSLNTIDHPGTIRALCSRVNELDGRFPGLPNVAGICVFPVFVEEVKSNLKVPGIEIVSVAAGFPASQTFLEIKIAEVEMAVRAGATEIDTVFPLGKFLDRNEESVLKEIGEIQKACKSARLKVILETGALQDLQMVARLSYMSLESGADFIKTSTGKLLPAATPEKFFTMALALRSFYQKTGIKRGIKAAGGIATPAEAFLYFSIVDEVLGKSWLQKDLFRIGASRLANNLLAEITNRRENMAFSGYF